MKQPPKTGTARLAPATPRHTPIAATGTPAEMMTIAAVTLVTTRTGSTYIIDSRRSNVVGAVRFPMGAITTKSGHEFYALSS